MKHILRSSRVALLAAFDLLSEFLLALWLKVTNAKQSPRRHKYGFIFTSDIGDTVVFSMFLLVFSKKIDSECLVVTSETNARLMKHFFPKIEFLTIDYAKYKTSLTYRFWKIRETMAVSLDRCIVPMRSRDYCITDSITRIIRKNNVLVFDSDESNRNKLEAHIEKFIYDELLGGFSVKTHELLTYELLLDRFGVDFQNELAKAIPLFRERAREATDLLPSGIPNAYALMNVGASQVYKRWPIEKFIALAKKIHVELGLVSLFIGGPSEKDLQGSFEAYPFIIDLVMKTGSFDVVRNIIVNAKFVVSNDTFASHYSAVLGVPVVSIAGGGHFGRFLPYPKDAYPMFSNLRTICRQLPCFNCGWACTRLSDMDSDSFPCISEIGVEEVFAALELANEKQNTIKKRNS